jgi:tripartite-type tricarboxylate transporter receptor subunit TctC
MKKPPDAHTTLKRRKSLKFSSQPLLNKAKMRIVITILMVLVFIPSAHAQDANYPKGLVKVLVGFPAGQTTDMIARTIGEKLADKWKQPVLIENIPGAVSGNPFVMR